MIFVDIPFPECIAFGAQSDPMWQTELAGTISGWETANQNWSQARHAFDLGFAVRNASDYLLVRSHFHQMRGRAKSFPFKDFLDYQVAQAEGVLLASDSDWQMHKRYGVGDDAYDRRITRPRGTIAVFRTRSGSTTNVTGSATVDDATGLVTIAGHVADDTYAWSGEFVVPCRYDTDRLPSVAINKEPGANGELLVDCGSIPLVEVRE